MLHTVARRLRALEMGADDHGQPTPRGACVNAVIPDVAVYQAPAVRRNALLRRNRHTPAASEAISAKRRKEISPEGRKK